MHILLISHYYAPEIGAPQRRLSALVGRLRGYGFEVTVLCPPPHYPEKFSTDQLRTGKNRPFRCERGEHGESVVRLPYVLHGYRGSVRAVDQLVTAAWSVVAAVARQRVCGAQGAPFDVVISTVPGLPSLFAGVAVSKVLGVPHVAEVRDAWPDVITGDIRDRSARIAPHKLVVKRAIDRVVTAGQRAADAVVVTTPRFAEKLRERGVRRVAWIANGAEQECFSDLAPREKGFWDSRVDRTLRVQYLGTVGRSQGLQVLVEALEILRVRSPHVKVQARVVGNGAEVPRLKVLAQRAQVDVAFFPNVPRSELERMYDWADVALVSLRRTRPFRWTVPSKIFELMATRRFVLALVEGNAADLVERSGVGSVVEPENAVALADELERLAENPDALLVGDSGVELLKSTYSYDLLGERYVALLESVVGRGREDS